jgi:RimJ/RimL family protein N-acetyltransferase
VKTARLHLRQWHDDDLARFASLNADPEVMRHFPAPLEATASDAMARRMQAHLAEFGWGNWAVERLDTGAFIGFVGLSLPRAPLPFAPCVEIGWRLARAHWGQGFATEAAREALRIGFVQFGFAEMVSFTALTNLRSIAVMERIGLRRDPLDFEHPSVPVGNPLRPHCLYRLARAQWSPA